MESDRRMIDAMRKVTLLVLGLATIGGFALAACGGGDEPSAPTSIVVPTSTPVVASTSAPTPVAQPTAAVPPLPAPGPPATSVPTPTATAPPAPTGSAPRAAILEIRVTDAPPEGVTKILVTASQIEVNKGGGAEETGWQTVVPGPVEFDLVALTGIEELLGSREMDPGRYGQVRLSIDKVVVTLDGVDLTARVPSGKIKIVGGFTLEAGMTTILTLDFDADKSVVITGSRNVLVKPVIKLLVRDKSRPSAAAGQVGQTGPEDESEAAPTATPAPTSTPTPTPTPAALP